MSERCSKCGWQYRKEPCSEGCGSTIVEPTDLRLSIELAHVVRDGWNAMLNGEDTRAAMGHRELVMPSPGAFGRFGRALAETEPE